MAFVFELHCRADIFGFTINTVESPEATMSGTKKYAIILDAGKWGTYKLRPALFSVREGLTISPKMEELLIHILECSNYDDLFFFVMRDDDGSKKTVVECLFTFFKGMFRNPDEFRKYYMLGVGIDPATEKHQFL